MVHGVLKNLKFNERLYAVYLLFPYCRTIGFIFSILFLNKIFVLGYQIHVTDYEIIKQLLSLKQFSSVFLIKDDRIEISFDNKNFFHISKQLENIDKALIRLLDDGIKDGAIFIDEKNNTEIKHDKTIKIIQSRKIVEVFEGIKFNLEQVGAMTEIFIRRIHESYSKDLNGKIVVDMGASVGDTPLYFASKGATVYAVEMTKTNFESMKKNIELNPHLSDKIIPIHLAFGKDGIIEYYQDALDRVNYRGGASFVKNKYGKYGKKNQVQGMSLNTFRKKYDLPSIDLLKIDCKGGEFFLKEEELKNIKAVKIEYYSLKKEHKVSSLLDILGNNFNKIIFKHTPSDTSSFLKHGNILAYAKN